MDSNNFKKSQNFDNIEKNMAHNPNLDSKPNKMAQDYVAEMRSKKLEANREEFMTRAKENCPPEEWENSEKDYQDAWENHKNELTDEVD